MNQRALGSVLFVVFLDMLGFGVIIPVIRDLAVDLTKSNQWQNANVELLAGLLMASYSLGQFIMSPYLGRLSDRWGRRPVMLVSVAGSFIAYVLWAVSDNFWLFWFSRLFAGTTAANISVAQSYIADVTEERDRSQSMALMGALFGLGFTIGPFLGGLLSSVQATWFPEAIPHNRFSLIGLVCAGFSATNLIWIAFVLKEPVRQKAGGARSNNLLEIFRHLRRPDLGRLYLIFFIFNFGFVLLETSLSWVLLHNLQLDTRRTGMFFAFMGVVMVIVQGGVYRPLVKAFGELRLIQRGMAIVAISLALIPLAEDVQVMAITITGLALGMGMTNPSLSGLISLWSSKSDQGLSLGIAQSFGSLARILAPMLAMALYASVDHGAPFWAAAVISLISWMITWKLRDPFKGAA